MARQKKEQSEENTSKASNTLNKAKDFLNKHKINDYASTLSDSPMSVVKEWIDSGSYSLNKVLSGSYYKGFADNRLYVIAGPSSTGKSLIAGKATASAQKIGYTVAYFDSENAVDINTMKNLGVNVDELMIIPVKTISEFKNQAVHLMRNWRKEYGVDAKLMIICDSIGNLSGTKEMNDIEENKTAQDMGQRAKELRQASRLLSQECGHNRVPMICTNHTYEQAAQNPNAAPTIKMAGGEGFYYSASAIIYLKKRAERDVEKNLATGKDMKVKTGNILIATSEKNRFVPEGTSGEIYLDFKRGLNHYYGLLNDALEFGFIEKKGPRFEVKHLDKSIFESKLYGKDVFGPILDDLNKKVEEKYKFVSLATDINDLEDSKEDDIVDLGDDDQKSESELE